MKTGDLEGGLGGISCLSSRNLRKELIAMDSPALVKMVKVSVTKKPKAKIPLTW